MVFIWINREARRGILESIWKAGWIFEVGRFDQTKGHGLHMRDSKKPLAAFTQGKSIRKAVSWENPSGIFLDG